MRLNIEKLETERRRKNLSKEAFSEFLGLHRTSYGKILKHESTTIKTLNWIAEKLHVNPLRLLV